MDTDLVEIDAGVERIRYRVGDLIRYLSLLVDSTHRRIDLVDRAMIWWSDVCIDKMMRRNGRRGTHRFP